MPLFGSRNKTQNSNAAQDGERLARGLLPLGAEQRLRRDAGTAGFTATLGAREFALLAGDDVLPVGIVTGSCVFHVGTQWPPMQESAELTVVTAAHLQVRRRALDRLQQEAALLRAHGVLDVTLAFSTRPVKSEEGGGELLEYTVTGTAVRLTQGEPPPRPFLCNLTASEFWTLRRAGYRPCGIALGACAWYHVASPALRQLRASRLGRGPVENVEFAEYSEAVQAARRLAADRMRQDASHGLAEGVVGLYLTTHTVAAPIYGDGGSGRYNLIVRVLALGTAIAAHRGRWPILDYAVPLNG